MDTKKYIFAIILIIIQLAAFTQQFDIEFQHCYGGSAGETGQEIIMLADSSFLVLGSTASNDGDISFNHGEADIWLTKYDKFGLLEWEKTFGGSKLDTPNSLAITSEGDYVIFGQTQSNDGDVSGNHGEFDYWVFKTDSLGNILWQKCLGSSVNDFASKMRLDTDGNIYAVGESHGNDGDISSPRGSLDSWVVKLSPDGDLVWEQSLGGTNIDAGICILPTDDGGYITGGYVTSFSGDVSCTTPNTGNSEAWIVKLDSLNNIQWDHCYGGTNQEIPYDILESEGGGYIVVCGTNSDDGDVTGFHGSPGGENYDFWVLKVTVSGDLEWQRCLGGTHHEDAAKLTDFGNGEYIISGNTNSNDGDVSGNHSTYYPDIWLVKIDTIGDLIWQQCFGSSRSEGGAGITIIDDIHIMVAAGTRKVDGNVDCELFHPGTPLDGDLWLFRLVDTVTVSLDEYQISPEIIIMYPNPADDIIYYYSNTTIDQASLLVYNIFGQKVDEFNLSETNNQVGVDVSDYVSGVYVAILYSRNNLLDRRLFVVK